ncbi:alpha/beta-hydrolase [Exidia glandulosa HHB12029]|uniref:Alpha/beta-hydrolase n=1 Tax=Exidia glandulosa HHB12029 TaxID=1314781 RepID=A0A165J028_EXIGL|nr:alpha/beta-hydrolase [Exidia glandulosa HHB12029]
MPLSLYGRLRVTLYFGWMNTLLWLWKATKGPYPRRGFLPPDADITPTITGLTVQSSKDPNRKVKINVFYPPGRRPGDGGEKLPMYLNVHGSGYCFEVFPTEAEIAAYIALKAHCIVVDTDYAKAPRHPFPAAYNDVSDVARYILSSPYPDWDLSRLAIGGASSGGSIALAVAVHQPKGTFTSVVTLYPGSNVGTVSDEESERARKIPKGCPGHPLGLWQRTRMIEAYTMNVTDMTDPRLSPYFAPADAFPPVTIVGGDCDPLLPSIQALAKKLREAGNDYDEMIVEDAGHGWERLITPGDKKWEKLREEAMGYYVSRLRKSWDA